MLSNRPSSAQPRFGTSKRSSMAMKTDSPGPGAYKFKSSLGAWLRSKLEPFVWGKCFRARIRHACTQHPAVGMWQMQDVTAIG